MLCYIQRYLLYNLEHVIASRPTRSAHAHATPCMGTTLYFYNLLAIRLETDASHGASFSGVDLAAFCPAWRCRASRTATSSSSVVQDIQGSQMSFNALTSAWWHCQAGCCAPGISALPDVGSRPHATRHHGQAFSDSPFSERTVHLSVPFTGVAMTWLFPLTPRRMLGMHSSCHDSPAFSLRWCAAT
jgi:hypothetical protein